MNLCVYQKSNQDKPNSYNQKNRGQLIYFSALKNVNNLPKILYQTSGEKNPVNLPGVSIELASKIIEQANKFGTSVDDYLRRYLPHLASKLEGVIPEASVTANVGKTKVATLIDAQQIFDKVIDYIKSAKKSIQIEMFEFQNIKNNIDGDIWPSKGAEIVPGWEQQQEILKMLVEKKKADPDMNIQVILDTHKWYQDGNGLYRRHYNNINMIKYLKDNGIDVVPYPRASQNGTLLQHVKFMAIDGKKLVLGGMNWGNHSAVNHDACVSIETRSEFKHSEVDNIIAEFFHKDWKFAWQRLSKTKFVSGPVTPEEQVNYKGRKKKIHPESVEYVRVVGNIFDKPEYRNRFKENRLNLPEVKPIKNPEMLILTNSPREYSFVNDKGAESIGDYIKRRLDTATSLKAELFVLSHKEIVNKIIKRYNEAQSGGRPLDVQILISPGILDDFPYCRKAFNLLEAARVPIRFYKVNELLEQRLHSKWAVFDENELVIGSANWSAVGLENNLKKGKRSDYPLTNEAIDQESLEHKPKIDKLEKELGVDSIFDENNKVNYTRLLERKKALKSVMKTIEVLDTDKTSNIILEGKVISSSKEDLCKVYNGYCKLIKIYEGRRNRYKRGNHECAVVVKKQKLASVFLHQFKKDWEYSKPEIPEGYGSKENNIAFMGRPKSLKVAFIKAKEPSFDRLV